jgi:hypothetical protein
MQPPTRFHDSIANPLLQEAYLVFHHAISLHPTDGVFTSDADGRDGSITCLLRWGECPTRGGFLGLEDGQPITCLPLEAHLLIETTSGWEARALQRSEDFLMRLPFLGGTQEAHMTGLIDDEEVFDRGAFLLAPGAFLLVLGSGATVDGALRALMPQRGDSGAPLVRAAVSRTANSSAVRAGRSSWCAQA